MTISTALAQSRNTLTGPLFLPGDDEYEVARQPWNRAIEQRPAAVAVPQNAADLRELLSSARDAGATVAVQPSGHGAFSDLSGAILVRMGAFDELEIDAAAGVARIGAGVQWGRVIAALEGSGWSAPSGTSPVVTPVGYTLGGGHSWFSRTAGLGSDNLRAAWVVRTNGVHERVDDATDPDLMWALRGAGGLVGIVTAIEIDLVPTPALWGGSLMFEASDTPSVLRAVRDLAAAAPDTLNVFVSSMRLPDAPQLPEQIRGRSFLNMEALAVDESALALLDGIRGAGRVLREHVGTTSPAALAAKSLEPTDPSPSRGSAVALTRLTDEAIDAVYEFRERPEQWPLVGIDIRMLGGALKEPRREGFASLASAEWIVHGLAPMFPGAPVEPGAATLAGFGDLFGADEADAIVPTFLAPGDTLQRCGSAADIERVQSLRARFDPDGILHEGRLPRATA